MVALADRKDSLLGCDEEVKLRTPARPEQLGTEPRTDHHMKKDLVNGDENLPQGLKTPPREKTSPPAHVNIGRNGLSAFKSPVPSS
jgi:hypothetical protein